MPEIDNNNYPETHGTVTVGPDVVIPQAQGFLENIDIPNSQLLVLSCLLTLIILSDKFPYYNKLQMGGSFIWNSSLKNTRGGRTYQIKTNENGIEQIRVRGLPPIATDSLGRKWVSWVDTKQTTLEELDVQNTFVFVGFTAKGISNQVATPVGLLEPHKIQGALAESILLETPKIPDYRLFVELCILLVSGLLTALVINYLNITSLVSFLSLIALMVYLQYDFINRHTL